MPTLRLAPTRFLEYFCLRGSQKPVRAIFGNLTPMVGIERNGRHENRHPHMHDHTFVEGDLRQYSGGSIGQLATQNVESNGLTAACPWTV